jgi:hypothetical protein
MLEGRKIVYMESDRPTYMGSVKPIGWLGVDIKEEVIV